MKISTSRKEEYRPTATKMERLDTSSRAIREQVTKDLIHTKFIMTMMMESLTTDFFFRNPN